MTEAPNGFIPLRKTLNDFKELLKSSALTGKVDVTVPEIMNQLRSEPVYDLEFVLREVQKALVAPNEFTNCITGDASEHVVVTFEKLQEVLDIIRDGGTVYVQH